MASRRMFRSDHYLSGADPEARRRRRLDADPALAARTERLRLGTLVSPVTFRHPAVLAKAVVTADHVSGGRVELGMGTGWMDAEHEVYGIPFPPMKVRARPPRGTDRDRAPPLDGRARIQPKPVQQPHPPLLVGGSGLSGTIDPGRALRRRVQHGHGVAGRVRRAAREAGARVRARGPGADPALADDRLRDRRGRGRGARAGPPTTRTRGPARRPGRVRRERGDSAIVGTVEQAAERLRAFEQAGVERVMLQHLDHTDLDMVALIGRELAHRRLVTDCY